MGPQHPCPICDTLTQGTVTENGFTWDLCPDCLEKTLAELEAVDSASWVCRVCDCTDQIACPGGCAWAEPNLCSRCAVEMDAIRGLLLA